jgi:O-antigen/teichoic acid export membrane protein
LRTYFWQSAIVLLVMSKGEAAAGALYGPLRLMEHSKVLPFAFVASMLPVLSSQAPSSKGAFAASLERAFKVSLVAGALFGVAFTSLSNYIVALLLGPGFSQSVQALQLLGWVPALLFPNLFLGMSLVALDKQVLETLILSISLIVSLACNLVLIPGYGFLGPCYGILLAEAVFFIVSLVYLWRHLAAVFLATMAAKVLVCTLAFALLVRLGRGYNELLALSTGLLVFVGGLFLLRAVDREELSTLKRLVFDRSSW